MLNETQITGQSWLRAKTITIYNSEPNTPPVVRFEEETYTQLSDGRSISNPGGATSGQMGDPTTPIALLDPNTLEPTGATITHGELYAAMVGLWVSLRA